MVAISHVGVEQVWLDKWMASPDAALFAHQFKMRHKNRLIIAGFDGCHRLAGVGLKLLAFERFLEEFPNARDGVRPFPTHCDHHLTQTCALIVRGAVLCACVVHVWYRWCLCSGVS